VAHNGRAVLAIRQPIGLPHNQEIHLHLFANDTTVHFAGWLEKKNLNSEKIVSVQGTVRPLTNYVKPWRRKSMRKLSGKIRLIFSESLLQSAHFSIIILRRIIAD
jgi:hypothetical protein